jgi:uncharacterized protein YjbI with pentapeptide repeats
MKASSRIVHVSKTLKLAVLLLAAALQTASAANPKDVKRAKNMGGLGECIRCDLSGADFTNGFFQLANMIEANLSGGKFDGANMAGTQLNNANLSNGSFTYVNFSGARLDGADLRGANLSKAWLNWAWLAGAKLDGADFTGAHLIGAQIQGADLRNVKGLTTLQVRNACGDSNTKLPPGVDRPWCPF